MSSWKQPKELINSVVPTWTVCVLFVPVNGLISATDCRQADASIRHPPPDQLIRSSHQSFDNMVLLDTVSGFLRAGLLYGFIILYEIVNERILRRY